MKKNVASQHVGGQIINATTGAAVTASVSVSVSGDGGAFGPSGGTLAHLANGWWDYIPTQAETNYDFVAYQFTASGAIPYTASAYTTFPQTGDSYARLGAPAGASVSADVAAAKTDTAAIKVQTDKMVFTAAGFIDANTLKVGGTTQTARDLGLQLDATVSSRLAAASYTAPDNTDIATILADITAGTGTIYDKVLSIKGKTDSLTFTVAGVLDANVVDWKGTTAPAMTGDAYARLGAPAGASISADIAGVAASVWDVTLSGHVTAGSTGFALNAAGSAGDPWGTALPGAYAAGTAGYIVGNRLDAAVTTRLASASYTAPDNSDIASILADVTAGTGTIFDKVNTLLTRVGAPVGASISADVAAVQTSASDIQGRIPAALTGGGNMKADILAVNADTTAAANLAKATRSNGRGTVSGTPSTTSIPTSAFTPNGAVADQFKGRIITFDADTATAALRGQATDISANTSAANPTFTVTALTTAPAAGDTFSVT